MSRERIGSEVDIMMRSARPTQAMTLIGELGLAATVFPAPEDLVVEEGGAISSDGVAALPATWCVRALSCDGMYIHTSWSPLDREMICTTKNTKQVPPGAQGHRGDGEGAAL